MVRQRQSGFEALEQAEDPHLPGTTLGGSFSKGGIRAPLKGFGGIYIYSYTFIIILYIYTWDDFGMLSRIGRFYIRNNTYVFG